MIEDSFKKSLKESLSIIESGYNSSYHTSLKTLPCLAAQLSSSLFKTENFPNLSRDQIHKNITLKKTQTANSININKTTYEFQPNKFVFVETINPSKLEARCSGPYKILGVHNDSNCVSVDFKGKLKKVNTKLIKPFKGAQDLINLKMC